MMSAYLIAFDSDPAMHGKILEQGTERFLFNFLSQKAYKRLFQNDNTGKDFPNCVW